MIIFSSVFSKVFSSLEVCCFLLSFIVVEDLCKNKVEVTVHILKLLPELFSTNSQAINV